MTKNAKEAKPAVDKAAALKAANEAERPKYGIEQLEEATGLQAPSIRVALRDSPFTKPGRYWGWNTKAEFDAVTKWFKERSAKSAAKPAASKPADAKAKPAPKAKAKAAA